MNILIRIKKMSETFNVTEQKIANFILENYGPLRNQSIQIAAINAGTSTASLYRFSKKIGCKGFSDLKKALIDAYPGNTNNDNYDQFITKNKSIEMTIINLLDSVKQTINATFSLINFSEIEIVATKIQQSKKIFLYGSGISGVVVDDFRQKIDRLGLSTHYTADPHCMINALSFITKDDLFLIVSYSGENLLINKLATYAKQMNAYIVVVTGINKNSLVEIADVAIKVPVKETELRLAAINSRYSCMVALDILYFYLVKENLEDVREKILLTYALAQLIN